MEGSSEQQMQQLTAEYERKLAELKNQTPEHDGSSAEGMPAPVEHKAMSQAVEGMIQEQVPEFHASHYPLGHANDDQTPEARGKIQEWVNIAFSKGPYESVRMAKDSGDAALLDEYHAALTGDLYRMLVEKKQLEEVK